LELGSRVRFRSFDRKRTDRGHHVTWSKREAEAVLKGIYAQFGCGCSAPAEWRNFDASPTLRLQRLPIIGRRFRGGAYPEFPQGVEFGDVVKGLPLPGGSCRGVYASHVLEHLALDAFRRTLVEVKRLLETGGIFRMVVPDLESLARDYLASTAPCPSSEFMERAGLGWKIRPRGLRGMFRGWIGNSLHRWMWDERSLGAELRDAGFVGVRRAVFGDSQDRRFGEVEDPGRWDGCLGMECRKR
jgi:hypothetical protein